MKLIFLLVMIIILSTRTDDACQTSNHDESGKNPQINGAQEHGLAIPKQKDLICGKPVVKPFAQTRVAGGTLHKGSPWALKVKRWDDDEPIYCVAGVIDRGLIITTIQCVPYDEIKAGRTEYISRNDDSMRVYEIENRLGGFRERKVAAISLPPKDFPIRIAILYLDDNIYLDTDYAAPKSNFHPLCGPIIEQDINELVNCHITGWGHEAREKDKVVKLRVEIIGQDKCKEQWPGHTFLPEEKHCAEVQKEEGTDEIRGICKLDVGAPVACYDPRRKKWVLVALVIEADPQCNRPTKPAILNALTEQRTGGWVQRAIGQMKKLTEKPRKESFCGKPEGLLEPTKLITSDFYQNQGSPLKMSPWTVYIKLSDGKDLPRVGSLLDDDIVMTFRGNGLLYVKSWAIQLDEIRKFAFERMKGQDVEIQVFDASYVPGGNGNYQKRRAKSFYIFRDHPAIVFLKLDLPFDTSDEPMTEGVQPLCRAEKDVDSDMKCLVSAWGPSTNGHKSEHMLHHAWMQLYDKTACAQEWAPDSIAADEICAQVVKPTDSEDDSPDFRPCKGNEGAALACYNSEDSSWFLAALLVKADECPDESRTMKPAIFKLFTDQPGHMVDEANKKMKDMDQQ